MGAGAAAEAGGASGSRRTAGGSGSIMAGGDGGPSEELRIRRFELRGAECVRSGGVSRACAGRAGGVRGDFGLLVMCRVGVCITLSDAAVSFESTSFSACPSSSRPLVLRDRLRGDDRGASAPSCIRKFDHTMDQKKSEEAGEGKETIAMSPRDSCSSYALQCAQGSLQSK